MNKVYGGSCMKTLIAYGTKYGCTEKCASMLARKIPGEVTVLNLKENANHNIGEYDNVIIGGSIYAGKIQGIVKNFCEGNLKTLLSKKVGLFICCGFEGEKAEKQLVESFPATLQAKAMAKGFFGSEMSLERMGFLDRMIVRKVAKITESYSRILEDNILEFAKHFSS
jgi:menaquinone-dependent protoporphyrinogen oxidase